MKRIRRSLFVLILCLMIGTSVYSLRSLGPSVAQSQGESNAEQSMAGSVDQSCRYQNNPFRDKFPNIILDRCRVALNGTRLKLDFDSLDTPEDRASLTNDAKIVPIKSGGLLVAVDMTLSRFDEHNRRVWTVYYGQIFFDFAFVPSTNLIYGTSSDNSMFILNASTGENLYFDSRNGSAAYKYAVNYGEDMCLVSDHFWFYRQDRSSTYEPINDGITCWRGTTALWHMDFPPDAELIVSGDKILAVTRTEKGVYVKEIIPPQT